MEDLGLALLFLEVNDALVTLVELDRFDLSSADVLTID